MRPLFLSTMTKIIGLRRETLSLQKLKEREMLTITDYGEGQCAWCLARGEGVHAVFKDGLSGFLCRKHLWEALKARSEKIEERHVVTPPQNRP